MSNSNFAKLFEVDGRQVLVFKTLGEKDRYVNKFVTYIGSTEASLDFEYDESEARDKMFLSIGQAQAESFLRMLK